MCQLRLTLVIDAGAVGGAWRHIWSHDFWKNPEPHPDASLPEEPGATFGGTWSYVRRNPDPLMEEPGATSAGTQSHFWRNPEPFNAMSLLVKVLPHMLASFCGHFLQLRDIFVSFSFAALHFSIIFFKLVTFIYHFL